MVMEKVKAVLMGTDLNGAPTKETQNKRITGFLIEPVLFISFPQKWKYRKNSDLKLVISIQLSFFLKVFFCFAYQATE